MHLYLYALIDSQTVINQVQVKQIVLEECKDRVISDRCEIYAYNRDSYNLFNITHKDILVNSSSNNINVEVTFSNDTVFILEKEVKTGNYSKNKCLRNLTYQIKVDVLKLDFSEMFLVLSSDVSSIPYQIFYTHNVYSCDYPITEKLDYQYKPFIMDGTCEWIMIADYGHNGIREIISNEDTLILGNIYKKVYWISCKQPTVKTYSGAIREKNKQVFFFDGLWKDNDISENMIYDFNLKVGDRMECRDGRLPEIQYDFGVFHIDTIKIEGILRRKYFFDSVSFTWTEGLGNEHDFTRPTVFFETNYNSYLAGVWHSGKALYCDGGCTCDEITSITDHDYVSNFHILNNPVENRLLQINVHASDFSKLDLYSFDAKLVVSGKIAVDKEVLEIPLLNLVSGNYIVILSRPDGSRESAKIVVL